MPQHIQKHSKLLVVSDTGMYFDDENWFAFSPVVVELEQMLSIFETITWIGFNRRDQKNNKAYKRIDNSNIKILALKRVGGKKLLDKLEILSHYPSMWKIVNGQIKLHEFIHCRAPSNPAIIAMILSNRYANKRFWFKYAGSWVGNASKSYMWQREKLKKLKSNCIITVNGEWQNQNNNILALDNPCLNIEDRIEGHKVVKNKILSQPIVFCFVGGLNLNKGISIIIDAFKNINEPNIGRLHVVGEGSLKEDLIEKSKNLNIEFHGQLSRLDVFEIYAKSNYIILPSKSEGFPKVIGEAMNFGCIPIVSNIGSVSQVIGNDNGFLLDSISAEAIEDVIRRQVGLPLKVYKEMIELNYRTAERYTYGKFLEQITDGIFYLNNIDES